MPVYNGNQTPHMVTDLREFQEGDLGRIQEIIISAFPSNTPEGIATCTPEAMATDTAGVLVTRSQAEIVSVSYVNLGPGAGKRRGFIDDVATHPDHLHLGYASAVLDFGLDWFRERGVSRVYLTSNDDRKVAHGLYRSRGFEIHETNNFQLNLK